ncbi:MAG TPA: UDP-3-O-acyl-N-acetylglucosamine deacetylase [Nitrospirae bacterium]|nr:UDP-3-O-acyl-N-acetylglucosamine deacetylase [Nitrospirota bacterium]
MRYQNTIKEEVHISGVGLHSGRAINMRLKPAPRDAGISFIRTDRGNVRIRARIENVADTTFATNLAYDGIKVGTVEHLLSALAGLKIDNLYVELDGPEVPIMDGSASCFTRKILDEGMIARQAKRVSCMRILKPVVVMEGPCQIAVVPYEGTRITFSVNYNHPSFGEQKFSLDISEADFIKEIAPAKTFGFLKDVKMLRSRGLARGGSLDNAIVVGESGILNEKGLRFKNEVVRHKLLDALGDISLLGRPIYAHVIANRAGHTLNIKLLRKILKLTDAWEIVSAPLTPEVRREVAVQI